MEKKVFIVSNLGSSNKSKIPRGGWTNIVCTLLARDYKGLGNQGSNVVLVRNETNRQNCSVGELSQE